MFQVKLSISNEIRKWANNDSFICTYLKGDAKSIFICVHDVAADEEDTDENSRWRSLMYKVSVYTFSQIPKQNQIQRDKHKIANKNTIFHQSLSFLIFPNGQTEHMQSEKKRQNWRWKLFVKC